MNRLWVRFAAGLLACTACTASPPPAINPSPGSEPDLPGRTSTGVPPPSPPRPIDADSLFKIGSYDLRKEGVAILTALAEEWNDKYANRTQGVLVLIKAYADGLGTPSYNEELTMKRTKSAQAALEEGGALRGASYYKVPCGQRGVVPRSTATGKRTSGIRATPGVADQSRRTVIIRFYPRPLTVESKTILEKDKKC